MNHTRYVTSNWMAGKIKTCHKRLAAELKRRRIKPEIVSRGGVGYYKLARMMRLLPTLEIMMRPKTKWGDQ